MKITAVETIHQEKGITVHAGPVQWMWVRIHTDAGLVGLGETYPHPEAEKAIVHRSLAPVLLGRDPLSIDRLWADMFQAISYSGWAGAEMRASARLISPFGTWPAKPPARPFISFSEAHPGLQSAPTTPAMTESIL